MKVLLAVLFLAFTCTRPAAALDAAAVGKLATGESDEKVEAIRAFGRQDRFDS
jgi:hypothetical protein